MVKKMLFPMLVGAFGALIWIITFVVISLVMGWGVSNFGVIMAALCLGGMAYLPRRLSIKFIEACTKKIEIDSLRFDCEKKARRSMYFVIFLLFASLIYLLFF